MSANLGFKLLSLPFGDGHKTVARFRCLECADTLDFTVVSGAPLNPEHYAKKAGKKGWKADAFRSTRTYCPRCAGPPKRANDTDSELRKVIPMSITPIKPPVEVRDPTPDQRVAIRNHLDKSFDDAAGMYLDGMSDQRLAELVGVPRIIVERLREAAYGPIKVDPVTAKLRDDLTALRSEIQSQLQALSGLQAKAAELASRVEKALVGRAA